MDIPTIRLTRTEFEALPVSQHSGYNQTRCRYHCTNGQWLLIDSAIKEGAAVIEINTRPERQRRP